MAFFGGAAPVVRQRSVQRFTSDENVTQPAKPAQPSRSPQPSPRPQQGKVDRTTTLREQIAAAPLSPVAVKKEQKQDLSQEDMVKYRQMLEQQALQAATERVSQMLQAEFGGNMLQRTEQLDRIGEYKRQVLRDKTAVDARLKTLAETHTSNYRNSLTVLNSSADIINDVKLKLALFRDLCETSEASITQYDAIREVNTRRNNLFHTRNYLDNIFTAVQTAQELDAALDADDCNLLFIHSKVSELENCRDELLYYVRNDEENRQALESYFSDVEKVSEKLASKLWEIMNEALNICTTEPRLLVSALRIVEREETIDKEVRKGLWKRDTSRRPKQYRKKALDILTDAIENRFEAMIVPGEITKTVANFRFIVQDLRLVKEELVKRFPPAYDIFNFYLEMYHDRARTTIDGFAENTNDLQPGDIWLLLSFADQYREDMYSKLGVKRDRLAPPMLQGQADHLMNVYVDKLTSKMQSWCTNIIITEWDEWFNGKREEEPETDSDGYFTSQIPVILFQMVEQQISVTKQTNNTNFKRKVVMRSAEILLAFQAQYEKAITHQGQLYFQGQGRNEWFLEYMMIIVNNSYHCEHHVHNMANVIEHEGFDLDNQACMLALKKVLVGFEKLAALAYRMLIEVMFMDLTRFFRMLFTPNWYKPGTDESQAIGTIIATIEDYCQDFKSRLVPEYFRKLINETHQRFLVFYCRSMFVVKSAKINRQLPERVREEMDSSAEFFRRMGVDRVEKRNEEIMNLAELAASSVDFMVLHYADMAKRHPEFTLQHMEALLQARDDISRAQRSESMKEMAAVHVKRDKDVKSYLINFYANIPVTSSR